jgi:DNA invertase Pin-like site-specific DNA recombinase
MRIAIYTRVSTQNQTTEQQLKNLQEYCNRQNWTNIQYFTDEGVFAWKKNRKGFSDLKEAVRQKKVDIVLVWKLDRLSRSLKELVETMDFFNAMNIRFISYTQAQFDTTTSIGKMMFAVFGAIAEFEKDLISERTKLKLQYLKDKGVKLGRKRKIDYNEVVRLREQGLSLKQIGDKLGTRKDTISKALKVIKMGG